MQFQENRRTLSNLVLCGVLSCIALVVFVLEALIPMPVPIPGVKLGLANVVTLTAIYILGRREAFMILIVRILLGSMFAGQMMSFIYSLSGGLLCYAVTALAKPLFNGKNIWILGTIGAIFHNFGQLICAYFMLGSGSLLYYGLVLTAAACITGSFTGLCAQYVIKRCNILKI